MELEPRPREIVIIIDTITPEQEDQLSEKIADLIESMGLTWHMIMSKPEGKEND